MPEMSLLETTFYALGIVSMIVFLLMAVIMTVTYFRVKQNIEAFRENMGDQVINLLRSSNSEVLATIALTITSFIFDRFKAVCGDKSLPKKKS